MRVKRFTPEGENFRTLLPPYSVTYTFPLLSADFRGAWEKACIAAGLCVTVKDAQGRESKKATALFHDFRRSCVRNLENAGTPRKVAKSITGHITDSVYERYHVVKEEDQRAALARVEAAFITNQHKTPENKHTGQHDRVPVEATQQT